MLIWNIDPLTRTGRADMRIIQLGMIRTDFGGRSFDFAMDESVTGYALTAAAMGRLFG